MKRVKWKFRQNARSLAILFIGISVNLLGKALTNYIEMPFWLDTIGTIYSAALLGPLAGLLVGALSNVVFVYFNIINIFYVIVNILVGITVGYFYPKSIKNTYQLVYTATILSFVTILCCTPINMLIYQGYTGNRWGDALCELLETKSANLLLRAALGEAFVDFPDKIISVTAATVFVWISEYIPFLTNEEEDENAKEAGK